MRFPVTGLVGRWRWLAVATAAATLVAMTFAPAAERGRAGRHALPPGHVPGSHPVGLHGQRLL